MTIFASGELAGVWLRLHGRLRACAERQADRSARPVANKVAWTKEHLGWSVEVVLSCAAGALYLKRGRTTAHARVHRTQTALGRPSAPSLGWIITGGSPRTTSSWPPRQENFIYFSHEQADAATALPPGEMTPPKPTFQTPSSAANSTTRAASSTAANVLLGGTNACATQVGNNGGVSFAAAFAADEIHGRWKTGEVKERRLPESRATALNARHAPSQLQVPVLPPIL